MHRRTYRTGIEVAYRRSALRVKPAFRTESTDAAVVIAGMMLLKLVVDVKRRKLNTRIGMDLSNFVQIVDDAMDEWQQAWANSNMGRWTYRLIPSVGKSTKRKNGQVNFYQTHLLTGHGYYRAFFYKYGHDLGERCSKCRNERESNEIDWGGQ